MINMIIISDYTLVAKENFSILIGNREVLYTCPVCHGTLHYRDSRLRIRKREGGRKEQLRIRRFRCGECHSYHNELPDCLVPYKHYEAEVIAGVLDKIVCPTDLDSEDYPSFSTMLRWMRWFTGNLERIEEYLQRIAYRHLVCENKFFFSKVSLLNEIREKQQNWMEYMLCLIYNSGGFLISID